MSGFIDNENENRVGTAGNLEQLRLNCKKERKIGIEKDREREKERENRRKQRSHNETKFFNQKRKQLEKSNCS